MYENPTRAVQGETCQTSALFCVARPACASPDSEFYHEASTSAPQKAHKLPHAISSFNAPSEDQRPTQTALSRAPSRTNNDIAPYNRRTYMPVGARSSDGTPPSKKRLLRKQANSVHTYAFYTKQAVATTSIWRRSSNSDGDTPRTPSSRAAKPHHTPATLRDSREKQTEVSLRRGADRRHHGE